MSVDAWDWYDDSAWETRDDAHRVTFPPPNTKDRCWCDRSQYRPHPQTPEHGHRP